MHIYHDLFSQAKSTLLERRYVYPQVNLNELMHAVGYSLFNDYTNRGDYLRMQDATPEQRTLLERIAKGYADAPTDPKRLGWALEWDGDTLEEFVASANVTHFPVNDNMPFGSRRVEVSAPYRYYDLEAGQQAIRELVSEYYDVSFDAINPMRATFTYREGSVPGGLARHLSDTEREQTSQAMMNQTLDTGLSYVDGQFLSWSGEAYNLRTGSIPLVGKNLIDRLEQRRNVHRERIRQNMPGYRAQRDAASAEQIADHNRRQAAMQRYAQYVGALTKESTMLIPTLPFVPHGVRASRPWGIEIETGAGRDLSGTPKGWESKDDGSLESAYDNEWVDPDDCPEYAEYHREATIEVTLDNGALWEVPNPEFEDPRYCSYCGENGHNYDEDDCVELVSPILTSAHSQGLEQICDDLEYAPRSDTAGIHVHVDATGLTVRQVGELVLAYDGIEHLIESSYDRHVRGYCKRRAASDVLEIAREGKTKQSIADMRKGDRYVTVNLQALDHHGTIEFRAMGPRYNYDHLVRWAMFCREMVNCAAAGATSKEWAKVKTWEGVLGMFAKYGKEFNSAVDHTLATIESDLVAV